MKVCAVGLWHLGTVTAACAASGGHDVIGLDASAGVVAGLAAGKAPISEPGLDSLLHAGVESGRLVFTTDFAAVASADLVWITLDTPVDADDRADVNAVVALAARLFPHLRNNSVVLVSSQVPVGTTGRLEKAFASDARGRTVGFAYSPENLRLGNAIAAFTKPDRVVAGARTAADRENIAELFQPFTDNIEWMSVESAEMTKHAVNAFLATSVTFINEIATLCEQVGADASEVERGLKSEARIGPKAYLSPGGAFAGGTLARDVMFLSVLGEEHRVRTPLISSVKASNDAHRSWAERRLDQLLGGVSGKTIAVWGLTYKPGTDTLRRSSAIELCQWLVDQGATVRAHDPAVRSLPANMVDRFTLVADAVSAVDSASALVVATPWPEYKTIPAADVIARMARRLVVDANRTTGDTLGTRDDVEYVSVGRASRLSRGERQ